MVYSIKKHEVDRLLNISVVLGWELKREILEGNGITVELHKDLSEDLIKAAGELDIPSPPQ